MKKARWFLSVLALVSVIVLGMVMSGCESLGPSDTTTTVRVTTTTTAATSSTTTSATTTTQAPPYTISGTVSQGTTEGAWTGSGVLAVHVTTDPQFKEISFLSQEAIVAIVNGQHSATFEITGLDPGTTEVYLLAIMYLGVTEEPKGVPAAGSAIGQFQDGLFPKFGVGTPEPVTLVHDLTGVNWQTKLTMPTLEAEFLGTITNNPLPPMQSTLMVCVSDDKDDLFNSIKYTTFEAVFGTMGTPEPIDTPYSVHIGQQGDYYIWSILYLMLTTTEVTPPRIMDRAGEYSDGLVPAYIPDNWTIFGSSESAKKGIPLRVPNEGDDQDLLDFQLKAIMTP